MYQIACLCGPLPPEKWQASEVSETSEVSSPLLGVHEGLAVYLLYNGILKDKSAKGGNLLTRTVQRWLIDNPHRLRVTIAPSRTLAAEREQQLQARLAVRRQAMSAAEVAEIRRAAAELLEAQRHRKSEQLSKEQLALFESAWQARSAEGESAAGEDDDHLDGDALRRSPKLTH